MNINLLVLELNLKPADAVVLNKKFFGMIDHYAIYLGSFGVVPQFVANFGGAGVKILEQHEVETWLKEYVPVKVDRFPGPDKKRPEALARAMSKIGQKAYSLVWNNCEHFKNFVHHGLPTSSQVTKVGGAMVVGGFGLGLIGIDRRNENLQLWALFLILVGALVAALGINSQPQSPAAPSLPPLGGRRHA